MAKGVIDFFEIIEVDEHQRPFVAGSNTACERMSQALLHAMGIGRQSMYDTFGDKKQLYLAALEHYIVAGAAKMKRGFAAGPSPLAVIEDFLSNVADVDAAERARGCLAVNAVAEFGRIDPGWRG